RQSALAAYAHQELPFEKVVEALAPERDAGRTPLFQVMLALQNTPAERLELPGLTLARCPGEEGTAKFDLFLSLTETAAGLAGVWEYSRDLFEAPTIARLSAHLEILLGGATAWPERRLADLPLLSAPERQQLVQEWNDREAEYPRESTVHGLFAAQAGERPDAVALDAGPAALSYRELGRRAGRLARRLARHGVGPEVLVGVLLESPPERVLAMLAVLLAGGAYVPLDPSYPPERLALLLADTAAPVVVAAPGLRGLLPAGTGAKLLAIDDPEEGDATPAPASSPAAASLAYVMHTSGSTGIPKGVAVPHQAVVRLARGTDYVQLGPGDRVAQLANTAFDAATFEIWGALSSGAALVIVEREAALAPERLAGILAARQVSTLFLTTALFHQMAREAPAAFRPLTSLLFGGEVADPLAVRRVLEAGPPARLVHVYGPTENTSFSTWHRVAAVLPDSAAVPIGGAIANSTAHVLDRSGRPAPIGVPGELYVGGDGLARGYLGRPERTAERFVPSPFGHGERLYRTGDLARRLPAGALDFLGRVDGQVKIRGFRIEPGEIEAALSAHPAVTGAAVLVRQEGGEKRLAAYVAGRPGTLAADLRGFLRARLPQYLVAADLHVLDALPLNPNGKIDRKALARIEPAGEPGGTQEGAGGAPRTEIEALLSGIWAMMLRRDRVGLRDNFFDLGGHSLLATQVISRIRRAFGVELPLRTLFERPTVEGLAAEIATVLAGRDVGAPPLFAKRGEGAPPLSFAQERLWFLDQLEPGSPAYNLPAPLLLRGRLAPSALAASFAEIVRRHEALRTTFAPEEGAAGRPVQVIGPALATALPLVDLAGLPAGARAEEGPRLAAAETRRPFDLARGPLLRVSLVRLAAEEHLLLVNLHHIVADGWSMG
ncbi:MAG: hypothetical protein QOJ16_2699, partial [Acidobacteriota bacterium]|nr:hypothetical protein [Acidobacteriota bacterium]